LGSTRLLTNDTGTVTDSYNYEALGSVLNQTGSTENNYLFTGEQYDAGLDQYYLRARYYNQNTGRFTQMDTWMGNNQDPVTLHKYLYANADPVTYTDPTGNFSMGSMMSAIGTMGSLANTAMTAYDVFNLLGKELRHYEVRWVLVRGKTLPLPTIIRVTVWVRWLQQAETIRILVQ